MKSKMSSTNQGGLSSLKSRHVAPQSTLKDISSLIRKSIPPAEKNNHQPVSSVSPLRPARVISDSTLNARKLTSNQKASVVISRTNTSPSPKPNGKGTQKRDEHNDNISSILTTPIKKNGLQRHSSLNKLKASGTLQSRARSLSTQRGSMATAQSIENPKKLSREIKETEQSCPSPVQNSSSLSVLEIYSAKRLKLMDPDSELPNFEKSKYSDKSYGVVKAFGVCTNQGLMRDCNEDRVSIVLNILPSSSKAKQEKWPVCNFFGVYDGHAGEKCAEFLRKNLHLFIIKSPHFPWNPNEAIKEGFKEADRVFNDMAINDVNAEYGYDKSGSCAIIALLIDDVCYIGNVGDCRAVISQSGGKFVTALSRDHKPSDKLEQKRIELAGGRVYQNIPTGPDGKRLDTDPATNPFQVVIPHRVLPGKLAISRAFGDIEAKLVSLGGNPDVVISKPEITRVQLNPETDFILLGSDGIYDKMENEELCMVVWKLMEKHHSKGIHEFNKIVSEGVIRESLIRRSLDNVTSIIISCAGLEQRLNQANTQNFSVEHKSPREKIIVKQFLENHSHDPVEDKGAIQLSSKQGLIEKIKAERFPHASNQNSSSPGLHTKLAKSSTSPRT